MRSRLNLDVAEEEAAIDMTPMLDVVFIMLIFFIVSTTFVRDQGVEINRPTAGTAKVQKTQGIIIAIDNQGKSWIAGQAIALAQLKEHLAVKLAQDRASSVLIKADTTTSTGDLIAVLDLVRSLGVESVAVATVQP
ncbi:MAG: biopolymer transporter ExbD [Pseudomonadales bacterium]|nr:biopolymer transporter ExbD [Pseudomonadales bacterium]NRA15977.1 biopolymer transporter ExbD [Oceanospirillaceae bacterium]